ncbi:hypothetical protein HPG69_000939 [Diceros bicornis minor]|uniref:Uncharacterized protein n=1 Tax=Diceros bicornis minor TaxID=77932 RepID=A0A7J7E5T2_DICBM|nr:hypothetical protein HPG69_000939 [Diceros bicornis minor]
MSFQRSEMGVSQAQLKPSTGWTSSIVVMAKPGLAFSPPSGASQPTLILESNGHSSKLGLDASLGMKNLPKLEDDALEGSAASKHGCQLTDHINALSALKQRILKRKLQFSKWRLACRFPGLQA